MKIAIVGAGPRGLLILSRLGYYFSKSNQSRLDVTLFDRYPVGGRVWRIDQNPLLRMDTVSQQITMFSRRDVNGPNLYQWSQSRAVSFVKSQHYRRGRTFLRLLRNLMPDQYAPRCLFGLYLHWFYQQTVRHLPSQVHVHTVRHFVYNLRPQGQRYRLIVEDGETTIADRVIINMGQEVNRPSRQEAKLAHFAHEKDLHYFPIGYVEDRDFSVIKPRWNVIVRGLGLNFLDCIYLLTIGRGGRFVKRNGQVVYRPSGREPRIIAGSRRGIPYYCKPENQKINGRHPRPHFLNIDYVKNHLHRSRISYSEFVKLLRLDMQLVYYTRLIKLKYPQYDADHFRQRFLKTHQHAELLRQYHFQPVDRFHWRKIMHPINLKHCRTYRIYRHAVLKWMTRITAGARRGNLTDPLGSALEVLRDSRNQIRQLVERRYFSIDDYVKNYLPKFGRINSFLSMGGPLFGMNRVKALMKAGILTILGPRMVVARGRRLFVSYSKVYPKLKFKSAYVVEAMNPNPLLSRAIGPLSRNLFYEGLLTRPVFKFADGQSVHLDVADVNVKTDQMIDRQHRLEPYLYTWGLSTEDLHWCTPTAPHPSGHDANLLAASRLAKQLLDLPFRSFDLM